MFSQLARDLNLCARSVINIVKHGVLLRIMEEEDYARICTILWQYQLGEKDLPSKTTFWRHSKFCLGLPRPTRKKKMLEKEKKEKEVLEVLKALKS